MTQEVTHRIAFMSADRPQDMTALAEQVAIRASRRWPASNLVVLDDPNHLGRGVGQSKEGLVVVSRSQATASDGPIREITERCLRELIPVMFVFDPEVPFQRQAPFRLHPVNGISWRRKSPSEGVADAILRVIGLDTQERKVFLSYRREYGESIALQLRVTLIDDGWDVFLDQFSIPPAADFQQQLLRALDDRSLVVLVESPKAAESSWIDIEVAFAQSQGIGIRSIVLPTVESRDLISRVPQTDRFCLRPEDVKTARGGVHLRAQKLEELVRSLQGTHADAVRARRESLLADVVRTLEAADLTVELLAPDAVIGSSKGRCEIVLVSPHLPSAAQIHRLHCLMDEGPSNAWPHGYLVHRLSSPPQEHIDVLQWIVGRRQIRIDHYLDFDWRLRG